MLTPVSYAASTYCPCPGACCPQISSNINSLNEITNYLAPWANQNKSEALMEKDLAAHRVFLK